MMPDLSVLWVIFFVLLCTALLNALLFKPLLRVMQARRHTVSSARALADKASADARSALAEFEAQTTAARAEVYREMDHRRRAALDERAVVLDETRRTVQAQLQEETTALRADVANARVTIERDSAALGAAVASKVLGRDLA
jgi:F-type H+-transporting ATPase subunit b